MSKRAYRLVVEILSTFMVRVLARLKPQRWCPPGISLRLFRMSSEPATARTAADVRRRLPEQTWIVRGDLVYATGRDGRFDLVLPAGPGPHPLVVWVHGGGWHFGSKSDALPYLELLAAHGFAGAAVNYPRAPRSHYPAAPRAVGAALQHLTEHAAEYGIDPTLVVLAGDSAGAQVAAEVATTLEPGRLRGVLLFCGIYDPVALDDSDRMFEAVLESAMWSLTGTRAWKTTAACAEMTVLDRVTGTFPPTFLAAGNADPLTRRQAPPMAARLTELGVPLDGYFPGDAQNPVNHEFQFALGTAAGAEALERTVAFLTRVTGSSISH